jgi:plastocyanin
MRNLLDDRRLLWPVLLTAVVIAVGSVVIILLTDDPSSNTGSAPSGSVRAAVNAGSDIKVNITDFTYDPETVRAKVGSRVTFVNNDAAPHTATAADGFDTGTLKQGASKTVKLDRVGAVSYVCEFHPFMKGTIEVK